MTEPTTRSLTLFGFASAFGSTGTMLLSGYLPNQWGLAGAVALLLIILSAALLAVFASEAQESERAQ